MNNIKIENKNNYNSTKLSNKVNKQHKNKHFQQIIQTPKKVKFVTLNSKNLYIQHKHAINISNEINKIVNIKNYKKNRSNLQVESQKEIESEEDDCKILRMRLLLQIRNRISRISNKSAQY